MRWSLAAILILAAGSADAAPQRPAPPPQKSALQAAVDEANRLAAEERGLPDVPVDVNLSNSVKGGGPKKDAPPKPTPNKTAQTKGLGAAPLKAADYRKMAQDQASDPDIADALIGQIAQNVVYDGLQQAGFAVNSVPPGYQVQVTGEVWLPGGGYSPRVTSYASNGGHNSAYDGAPGGPGFYASATTYEVRGDIITIHKAMQIGDQSVIMNVPVKSGETAVIAIPGGSTIRVTPVLAKIQ